MLTLLHLLRSYFSKEQQQTPALQFFKENIPTVSVIKNEVNGHFDMQWENESCILFANHLDGRDIHAFLLRCLSMAYPHCSGVPSSGGFELSSSRAARTSLLGADILQIKDLILEGLSDTQLLGMHDALRTPGVSSQRLSIGMTSKTLRLPKPDEILLSVHGSPLGVYKEYNMEAIHESEEG